MAVSSVSRGLVEKTVQLNIRGGHVPTATLARPLSSMLEGLRLVGSNIPGGTTTTLFSAGLENCARVRLHLTHFHKVGGVRFVSGREIRKGFFRLLSTNVTFFLGRLGVDNGVINFHHRRGVRIPTRTLERTLAGDLYRERFRGCGLAPDVTVCSSHVRVRGPNMLPPRLGARAVGRSRDSCPCGPVVTRILCHAAFLRD